MTKSSTSNDATKPKVAKKVSSNKQNKGSISGPQRILDFCLAMETRLNSPDVPRKMVVAASGVKMSTFAVTISNMKKKGMIQYDSESIFLTSEGRSKANSTGTVEVLDNKSAQADLKERFKLGGKAREMFDAMIDGRVHDRFALATQVGITNKGTLSVMLSNLKKNGIFLVTKTTLQLSDMCFPMGRPTGADEE